MSGVTKRSEEPLNMVLVSRALANHDAITAYTLISEKYAPPLSGRILQALIATVSDWPKAETLDNIILHDKLKRRELEVLRCAERGLTVMQTARELIIAFETVKSHRRSMMLKMGANSMGEAIHMARKKGLIE